MLVKFNPYKKYYYVYSIVFIFYSFFAYIGISLVILFYNLKLDKYNDIDFQKSECDLVGVIQVSFAFLDIK